jgi:hypothetical protein
MIVPIELKREMGCSVAEFERWLPGATRQAPIESTATTHRVSVGAGTVEILLQELPPRRIALMVVPVLSVTFRFHDMDETERGAFLKYFDHYTRRGGG